MSDSESDIEYGNNHYSPENRGRKQVERNSYTFDKVEDMIDDWKHGMARLDFCLKHDIREHEYKQFNSQLKLRGVVRVTGKKANFMSVLDNLLPEPYDIEPELSPKNESKPIKDSSTSPKKQSKNSPKSPVKQLKKVKTVSKPKKVPLSSKPAKKPPKVANVKTKNPPKKVPKKVIKKVKKTPEPVDPYDSESSLDSVSTDIIRRAELKLNGEARRNSP